MMITVTSQYININPLYTEKSIDCGQTKQRIEAVLIAFRPILEVGRLCMKGSFSQITPPSNHINKKWSVARFYDPPILFPKILRLSIIV